MVAKKVILVINSLQGGGAERFVLTMGDAFEALGYETHILRFNSKVEYKLIEGLNYHLVEYDKYRWLPKGSVRYRTFAKKVDNYILKNIGQVDLILSNLELANRVLAYSNLNNIVTVIHSTLSLYYDFENHSDIKKLLNSLIPIYRKHPCVCVSEGVKDDFIKYLGKITKVKTIYNPVDKDGISVLSREFVPKYQNYIIHIGSFKKAKRHDVLLKAYAKTDKSMQLLLAGQGKLENSIKELVKELEIEDKVIFLGFCQNPYPYLKHAKFKVLTSDREGFPMVLEEALALGVPVISTDCQSGPNEILPENNLMRVNDIDAISRKMNEIMKSPKNFKVGFNSALLPEGIAKKYLEVVQSDF